VSPPDTIAVPDLTDDVRTRNHHPLGRVIHIIVELDRDALERPEEPLFKAGPPGFKLLCKTWMQF
jgi:hypothetical protein